MSTVTAAKEAAYAIRCFSSDGRDPESKPWISTRSTFGALALCHFKIQYTTQTQQTETPDYVRRQRFAHNTHPHQSTANNHL